METEKIAELYRGHPYPVLDDPHRSTVGNWNDPVAQSDPERVLVESLLMGRINDALGQGQYYKWVCDECHFDKFGCGCHTIMLDGKPIIRAETPSYAVAHINGRYRIYPADRLGQFDDGHWYWRGIVSKCKNAPTYQKCALDWFGLGDYDVDGDCVRTCEQLGVDLSYLQKFIKNGGKK